MPEPRPHTRIAADLREAIRRGEYAPGRQRPSGTALSQRYSTGQPVLVVERLTRDGEGRPIESVRVVATADRTTLVYDELPITPPTG